MLCALHAQRRCSWNARPIGCMSSPRGSVRGSPPAGLELCIDATYGSDRAVDTERVWLLERPGRTVALGGTAETRRVSDACELRRAVTFGGSRCDGDAPVEVVEDAVDERCSSRGGGVLYGCTGGYACTGLSRQQVGFGCGRGRSNRPQTERRNRLRKRRRVVKGTTLTHGVVA